MNAQEDTHGHVLGHDKRDIVWPNHGQSHYYVRQPHAYGDLIIGTCPSCNTGLSTTGWCYKCNMFPSRLSASPASCVKEVTQ